PRHARDLEHDAQVVELLEPAEVDRQHVPAELGLDAEEALVAEAKQRLAHRRAAHAEALAELGLGEAVAGDELEIVDLRLERVVDLLGQLARADGGFARRAHGAIRLTCAATTRQPSAKRTQVWLCRPTRSLP